LSRQLKANALKGLKAIATPAAMTLQAYKQFSQAIEQGEQTSSRRKIAQYDAQPIFVRN
jgi:hypothetical protein